MFAVATKSQQKTSIKATKSLSFSYSSSEEFSFLFEDFRLMCDDAIRIAVKGKPKNRFKLIESAYARLKQYGLHTHYILTACEATYSVYRNEERNGLRGSVGSARQGKR